MADNTEFRRTVVQGWADALDAVRKAGGAAITVPVVDMAVVLDAVSFAEERAKLAEARLAEYENAQSWGTSCTNCANMLDSSIADYERAEKAKDALELAGRIVATSSRDWAQDAHDGWLYGLLVGWSKEALQEISQRFGWTDEGVAKLGAQRDAIDALGTEALAVLDQIELDVRAEHDRQIELWGAQDYPDGTGGDHYRRLAEQARRECQLAKDDPDIGPRWSLILLEEVYEALAEADPAKLRTELVQVVAVIKEWIKGNDRRDPE
jgi:hypothetical protein